MKDSEHTNKFSPLANIAYALDDRELMVLTAMAMRLLEGQIRYGSLTKGKKDWRKEAHEEAYDAAIYMACLLEDAK